MREHLTRWLQLELSPADAAILGEMHARELGKLQHDQDDGGHEDGNHGTLLRRRPYWHNSRGAARLLVWEIGRPNLQGAKSTPQG